MEPYLQQIEVIYSYDSALTIERPEYLPLPHSGEADQTYQFY
jgi:hypothetical protein